MDDEKSSSIRVVRRVLEVLEAFDGDPPRLSLQQIALRIDLPKSTTFRILSTLVEAGYVAQTSGQTYCLTHKVMRLAAVAQQGFDVRDVVKPVMADVAEQTSETVELSILEGMRRVCLEVFESPHRLKSIISPGEILPLHLGATGKSLLAYAAPSLVERVLAEGAGAVEPAWFWEELKAVRERGYALSQGERVVGASAISVPLRDHTGGVRYALTITGPSFRVDGRRTEFARALMSGGKRIAGAMGEPDGTVRAKATPRAS